MAGRHVGRDRDVAYRERLAILHYLDVAHPRELGGMAGPILRIILRRFAMCQRPRPGSAGGDSRAAQPLKRSDAAGMIEVRMRVDDQPHILGAETELSNTGVDERRRLRQPAVEQDQSVGRRMRTEERPDTPTSYMFPKTLKGSRGLFHASHDEHVIGASNQGAADSRVLTRVAAMRAA